MSEVVKGVMVIPTDAGRAPPHLPASISHRGENNPSLWPHPGGQEVSQTSTEMWNLKDVGMPWTPSKGKERP